MDVEVEYEYTAQNEDELSISKGELLRNCVNKEEGWMEGELHGRRGMFPDNFVKVVTKTEQEVTAPATRVRRGGPGHVHEMANKIAQRASGMGAPLPASKLPPNKRDPADKHEEKRMKARVIHDYAPEKNDELELIRDDVVEVICQVEDGWYEGMKNGKRGVFPSDFVEIVNGAEVAGDNRERRGDGVSSPTVPRKVVKGPGFGNIFADGSIRLKPTGVDRTKSTDNEKSEKAEDGYNENNETNSSPREKVQVLYKYETDKEDELYLEVGDILTVVDKNPGDEGWWKGELNGKIGLFPENFVKPITIEGKKVPPQPKHARDFGAKVNKLTDSNPDKDRRTKPAPMPPPVTKKPPLKPPEETKPAERDHHGWRPEGKKDANHDDAFNNAVESTPTLPVFDKPKQPNKRPPSVRISRNSADLDGSDGPYTEPRLEPRLEPSKVEERSSPKNHNRNEVSKPALTTVPESGSDAALIDRLLREVDSLKKNYVPRDDYDQLKDELRSLQRQFDALKDKVEKRLKMVIEDIDDEKKQLTNLRVDVDRLKKLTDIQ